MKEFLFIFIFLNTIILISHEENIERKPLVKEIYTADPSAHVFDGKIYIYPSHDETNTAPGLQGADVYDMRDYHVFVMPDTETYPTDLGCGLKLEDIPWASKQLWAPDCVEKDGKYYLVFPAKDKQGFFRIGIAIGDKPEGPFTAEPNYIEGSYSIDPCMFPDDDGQYYLVFGGLQGGQLDQYVDNVWSANNREPGGNQVSKMPKIALMKDNLLEMAEKPKDLVINDANGNPLVANDQNKRFFEAPWLFKKDGIYYLTYSTGTTHYLVYATSKNVYGPYKYGGVILTPVKCWTTHHSILEFNEKWYMFYHDCELTGVDYKRNIKLTSIEFNADGSIKTMEGQ